MDKPSIILSAETQFAREVTLGVVYQLPLPLWYSLIPGMFIFDFLRRNSAINRYTKYFMLPRKVALDATQFILNGQEEYLTSKRIHKEIERWLNSQNLLSQNLINAQKQSVNILIKHYTKLLNVEGNSYHELIENAYKSRKAFKAYLDNLEKAENQIDRAIMEHTHMGKKLKRSLEIEAQQVKLRRDKILESIF